MDLISVIGMVGAGMATALGALGALALRLPNARVLDAIIGFTAGIMLAAAIFSLLVPATDEGPFGVVLLGVACGAVFLWLLDRFVPHLHTRYAEGGRTTTAQRKAFMIVAALSIHNVPEGMAVGVAFAVGGPELGVPLAVAIGVQNVPEGFAASAPLVALGLSPRRAALVGAGTGVIEPLAAFAAFAAVSLIGPLLTFALAFAAAAMIYVVIDEMLPEAMTGHHERLVSGCFFGGFLLMMALDNMLG